MCTHNVHNSNMTDYRLSHEQKKTHTPIATYYCFRHSNVYALHCIAKCSTRRWKSIQRTLVHCVVSPRMNERFGTYSDTQRGWCFCCGVALRTAHLHCVRAATPNIPPLPSYGRTRITSHAHAMEFRDFKRTYTNIKHAESWSTDGFYGTFSTHTDTHTHTYILNGRTDAAAILAHA